MEKNSSVCKLLAELCVAELEEVTGGEGHGGAFNTAGLSLGLGFPQPQFQESSHPYCDDVTLTGEIYLSMRIERKNFLRLRTIIN